VAQKYVAHIQEEYGAPQLSNSFFDLFFVLASCNLGPLFHQIGGPRGEVASHAAKGRSDRSHSHRIGFVISFVPPV
jgi:hypothetical protein